MTLQTVDSAVLSEHDLRIMALEIALKEQQKFNNVLIEIISEFVNDETHYSKSAVSRLTDIMGR